MVGHGEIDDHLVPGCGDISKLLALRLARGGNGGAELKLVENVRRRMMRLMIISIGIMMIGLMAVLGAIVYKYNTADIGSSKVVELDKQKNSSKSNDLTRGKIELPVGSSIKTTSLNGSRILLKVLFKDGSLHLMVFDMSSASIIADFEIVNDN